MPWWQAVSVTRLSQSTNGAANMLRKSPTAARGPDAALLPPLNYQTKNRLSKQTMRERLVKWALWSVAIVTQQPLPRCSILLVAANFLGQLADMPLLFFYQCVTVIEPSLTDPSG